VEEGLGEGAAPFGAHGFDESENPACAIALLEAGAEVVESFSEFGGVVGRLDAADYFPASSPPLCMR
jgi:hypothetical protein